MTLGLFIGHGGGQVFQRKIPLNFTKRKLAIEWIIMKFSRQVVLLSLAVRIISVVFTLKKKRDHDLLN